MANINLTSITESGFLETDFDQIKGLLEDGTITAVTFDVVEGALKIGGVAVTPTAAELNYVDGVTSNIQTQLNSKVTEGGDPTFNTLTTGTLTATNFTSDSLNLTGGTEITWNPDDYTINIPTGLGPINQVGQEIYTIVYNDTGVQIDNGKICKVSGVNGSRPKIVLANATTHEGVNGKLLVTTMDIPNGEYGIATDIGRVRELNTNSWTAGQPLYVSTTDGELTNVKPEFPNYAIRVAGVVIKDLTEGVIDVEVKGVFTDTTINFWNGVFRETFDFRITESGGTVTGTLTPADGHDDMTMLFSDGFTMLDTNPGATISLTPGTDTVPQTNYVYIPKSTKVLTISTTAWPTAEHIKVAEVVLQSAATTGTNGALRNQNINDAIENTSTFQGHLSHIGERIRVMDSIWDTGAEATLTGTPTNGYIQTTEGIIYQMHKQTFIAQSMPTDNIVIVNHDTTPYLSSTDLVTNVVNDSLGNSLNNRWFSVVVWGVINKTGETSHLMCNIPSGGYASEANAVADFLGYTNYAIPRQFRGVGFLIARFTVRLSGGTWTYNSGVGYQDLRGFVPNSTAGSGAGSSGITTFLGLTDTPSTYTANYVVKANAGATALELVSNTYSLITDFQTGVEAFSINNLSEDTTPELGGELDCGAHSVGFTLQTATGDGTTTIDWKLGNWMSFTAGAFDETFTFTAPTKPGGLTLQIKQDATGGRDMTFPASVKWLGTEPTWTDGGANKTIIMSMRYDGTNYWAQATLWEE